MRRSLTPICAALLFVAPVAQAQSARSSEAVPVAMHRAGASLTEANGAFGSLEEILLVIGALGAGLLAAVEWWFEKDPQFSP